MMTMRSTTCALLVALALPLAAAAATGGSPQATLEGYNTRISRLLHNKEPSTAQAKVDRGQAKNLAEELIDFRELAKRSLAAEWVKLTPAQQDEFVATFTKLIENNYLKQLRSNVDYDVSYKGQTIEGDEATVHSAIRVMTRGKPTVVNIDYKLHKAAGKGGAKEGDRWMVWDVVTDGVSTVRNYKTQFTKIIGEKGYAGLLDRMKKKAAETSED